MGFGKNNTGAVLRDSGSVALGALADQACVKVGGPVLAEDFRILKLLLIAAIDGLTAGEKHNLIIGIANNELNVAEIAACLSAIGPLDRNDRGNQELAERGVFILGTAVAHNSNEAAQVYGPDGAPVIVNKHRWTYSNAEGWCFFVYNNTGAALTTGADFRYLSTVFGVWVT